MEFLIFRILRLIDREIEAYENLYSCLGRQHDNILEGKVMDLMVNMIEHNEIIASISNIEKDIKEDTVEYCSIMEIFSKEPTITVIVETLQEKYPKICDLFRIRSKKLDALLTKVEELNSGNIALLKNYKTIWKEIIPLYSAWTDFELNEQNNSQHEKIDEPIYEVSLN